MVISIETFCWLLLNWSTRPSTAGRSGPVKPFQNVNVVFPPPPAAAPLALVGCAAAPPDVQPPPGCDWFELPHAASTPPATDSPTPAAIHLRIWRRPSGSAPCDSDQLLMSEDLLCIRKA